MSPRRLVAPALTWLRDRGTFRRQIILLAAVVSLLAAGLLVLIVQVVLAGLATRTADETLATRADAVVASIRATSAEHQLRVPPGVLDVGVAVYDGDGTLVAGRPPQRLGDEYAALRPDGPRTVGPHEGSDRLLARDFETASGLPGRVVLAERLAPYEQTEAYALWLSGAAGVLLVLAATAVAAWASHRVLRPVAEMARTAEDWSEHDLTRRFGLGAPTTEIRALAATLDGLLDKVAHAIRTEQQLTGELAHELRTPLTVVLSTSELIAARHDLDPQLREDLDEIAGAGRRMADTITSLLELARSRHTALREGETALSPVLEDVIAHLPTEARPAVQLGPVPIDCHVSAPPPLVARALVPVVENAVRVAEHVHLGVSSGAGAWLVHVDDDGPGLAPSLQATAFEPGTTTGSGAGLGLALARRIARAAGGDVILGTPPAGWATRFTVVLPRAHGQLEG